MSREEHQTWPEGSPERRAIEAGIGRVPSGREYKTGLIEGPVSEAEKTKEKLHRLEQAAADVLGHRIGLSAGGSYLPDNPTTRGKLDNLGLILWGHRG